ncbi:MAG: hypothetical protein IJC81_04135 [Clostridia bacterium]|nr:hypothetical protein [Clostridia bacterium]
MVSKIFKILWRAFWIFLMLFVVGMLAFRFYTLNNYPNDATGIIPTDTLKESYKANILSGITWESTTSIDEDGYFSVFQPIYFEKEKTLILTIRYNDSLLEKLKHSGDGETLALFPALHSEDTQNVLPFAYTYCHAYGLYSYRRYVFEGITLSDYEDLYLNVYSNEDYDEALSSIHFYNKDVKTSEYKFTGRDKTLLSK